MFRYEKWLGAGLGWALTGNPLGGLLGFLAGTLVENGEKAKNRAKEGISEFEANLIVLASYLIKIDGRISLEEISFTQNFLNTYFEEKHTTERTKVLNHCLQKDYDLNVVCDQLRIYTEHGTRIQVLHFLFELAACDGELNEREGYFIFKVAGYLNINDVDFRKVKEEHSGMHFSAYDVLGLKKGATAIEIRNTYRKLVLKYHPDKNHHLSEKERRELAHKFQKVKEAYEQIKQGEI